MPACPLGRGLRALPLVVALFTSGLSVPARAHRGDVTGSADAEIALLHKRLRIESGAPSTHGLGDSATGDDEARGEDEELPAQPPEHERAPDDAPGVTHKVGAGETLSGIAKHYGVTVDQILERNPSLDKDHIREGQKIEVGGGRRAVEVTVQPGDTLTAIARANEVSLAELRKWNPKLNPDRIRDGQKLLVFPKKPPSLSESVGFPGSGQLVNARRLPPGPGYVVRASERAYATDETVRGIMEAFEHLRRDDPRAPRVWVHDLSLKRGGPMTEHRSHQSGRDADIAYPQRHCGDACDFRRVEPEQLDVARAFGLLKFWLERDELEAVFIDYKLQAPLYQYARAQGATSEQLRRWFQYPNGRDCPLGVIRHFRNHFDHMHVRFACHTSDPGCRTYRPLFMHTATK